MVRDSFWCHASSPFPSISLSNPPLLKRETITEARPQSLWPFFQWRNFWCWRRRTEKRKKASRPFLFPWPLTHVPTFWFTICVPRLIKAALDPVFLLIFVQWKTLVIQSVRQVFCVSMGMCVTGLPFWQAVCVVAAFGLVSYTLRYAETSGCWRSKR